MAIKINIKVNKRENIENNVNNEKEIKKEENTKENEIKKEMFVSYGKSKSRYKLKKNDKIKSLISNYRSLLKEKER